MNIETNLPYPNRVAWYLAPFVGPFVQPLPGTLGTLDPTRDCILVIDGAATPIVTWSFDAANNRYLLYTGSQFNLQGVVQLFHHMPNPPFGGLIG